MTVTLRKVGGSVALLIPKAIARDMELIEGTELALTTTADAVVLRKAARQRRRRALRTLVGKIKPSSYRRRKRETAEQPVGREVW